MPRTLETLNHDPRLPQLGPPPPASAGDANPYFSVVPPTPLPDPHLVAFNPAAAALIDLDPAAARRPDFVQVMAGNAPLPGGSQISMLYAGHQFGVLVPQLGDGRAILIGQIRNARGELWELQLKGAGKTPYSRFGDGRAVLRSTIREYLCGEAMAGLGIPTTRALCIVGSPEPVQRETVETAAVLCRMAPSHLRFGNFEVFYHRGEHDRLAPLADHVIENYFPHLKESRAWPAPTGGTPLVGKASVGGAHGPDVYRAWLTEVVERTARLIAQWQAVGFCHGVMNTDNMSILGLTLDYGPYGFMEPFESHWICNHSDETGRYAYDQQPAVGHWNCSRLLQATLPLLDEVPEKAIEIAYAILDRYGPAFVTENLARWRAKLGLREALDSDPQLIDGLLRILDRSRADFTTVFRALADPALARDHIADVAAFDRWLEDYRARLAAEQSDDAGRAERMRAVNPAYVLRNHLAQAAIGKAQAGDFTEIETLRRLLARPFDEQPGMERYAAPPPPGTQRVEVSCSS
ncbi:MAG: protein adenylyltransferase SelO [Nevskiaceae bacterium]